MILTEKELRLIVRKSMLKEEISMDAPFGDAVKNGLENISVAGLDIDDFQLGLDAIGIGADVISGLAAAGSIGPQAVAGVPISGVAGAVSIAADVTNASLYAARGEWYDAILSTIAIVPIGGSVIKVVGKVGKPLVKHMIVPIIKAASDGAKVDPKFIQNLIMSMDPSTLAKMEPGALVDFQKQINKHSDNIGGLISGIEKGDAKSFNKVLPTGKKIPDFAKDVFQGTMTKAVQNNPEISGYLRFLKGITGFFADPSIAKYTDDMATARKAVESGADPNALKAFNKKYEGQTPFDLAKTGKLTAQQRSAAFKKMLTKGGRNRRFMWGVVEKYGEDSPEADKVLEIMQLMEDHGEDSVEVKNALAGMVKETPAMQKVEGYSEAAKLFMNLEENFVLEITCQKLGRLIKENSKGKTMKITRKQLRTIIKESMGGPLPEDFEGDIWSSVAEYLKRGNSQSAMNSVLNHFWMDDTWRMEEDALEDLLIDLGNRPTPEEVKSASELWLKGYRAGEYRPQTKAEMQADWDRGGKPRTDYSKR